MKVEEIIERIEEATQEHSMPKRVRANLEEIKRELKNDEEDLVVRATSSIYKLNDITNDVNIPMHTKTALWDIAGMLERLKEE